MAQSPASSSSRQKRVCTPLPIFYGGSLLTMHIEVIEQANNTTYGLAASVFTKNIDRGFRAAHALEAGNMWVRKPLAVLPDTGTLLTTDA